MTVMLFQLEGSDETLQEGFRTINNVPDLAERTFLDEALNCFEVGAFRAAVVMTWNLAYHHLCDYILKNRLADFNLRWPAVFQGHHSKGLKCITTMDDFGDMLKESEVIRIAKSATIISNDVAKILDEKLGRRNSGASVGSKNRTTPG
jgi:hypothetical protein